jgi:hypothetical protein
MQDKFLDSIKYEIAVVVLLKDVIVSNGIERLDILYEKYGYWTRVCIAVNTTVNKSAMLSTVHIQRLKTLHPLIWYIFHIPELK